MFRDKVLSIQSTIFGLSGPRLTSSEKAFFRDANPWAFILFARNIETPDQVRRLTKDLRDTVGRDCMIFVDQEGGRVRRLRPPQWPDYVSYEVLARGYKDNKRSRRRAVWLHHRLMAHDLRAIGINADCAPVLDLPTEDADPIISDRAFGDNTDIIIDLANAAMAGLMSGGVAPVIKHIPGHGRATVDSHKALPRIETDLETLNQSDFLPFKALADAPMAMTAHAVFKAVDPLRPVTLSGLGIKRLIREHIGFEGLLMSDDLDMKALSGDLTQLTEQALAAGCDVALQCSGALPSMVAVAKGAQALSGASLERAGLADHCGKIVKEFDVEAGRAEYERLVPELAERAVS